MKIKINKNKTAIGIMMVVVGTIAMIIFIAIGGVGRIQKEGLGGSTVVNTTGGVVHIPAHKASMEFVKSTSDKWGERLSAAVIYDGEPSDDVKLHLIHNFPIVRWENEMYVDVTYMEMGNDPENKHLTALIERVAPLTLAIDKITFHHLDSWEGDTGDEIIVSKVAKTFEESGSEVIWMNSCNMIGAAPDWVK